MWCEAMKQMRSFALEFHRVFKLETLGRGSYLKAQNGADTSGRDAPFPCEDVRNQPTWENLQLPEIKRSQITKRVYVYLFITRFVPAKEFRHRPTNKIHGDQWSQFRQASGVKGKTGVITVFWSPWKRSASSGSLLRSRGRRLSSETHAPGFSTVAHVFLRNQ